MTQICGATTKTGRPCLNGAGCPHHKRNKAQEPTEENKAQEPTTAQEPTEESTAQEPMAPTTPPAAPPAAPTEMLPMPPMAAVAATPVRKAAWRPCIWVLMILVLVYLDYVVVPWYAKECGTMIARLGFGRHPALCDTLKVVIDAWQNKFMYLLSVAATFVVSRVNHVVDRCTYPIRLR
jgi:hypothetical protein